MITIIHGDDIASSRNYLLEEKNKLNNSSMLEGKSLTLNDLKQVFESDELFTSAKTIFIENFFTNKTTGKESDTIIEYLKQRQVTEDIFIWEDKLLTKASLGVFIKVQIKTFSFPSSIFLFLDGLRPGNGTNLISLFHQALNSSAAEQILFMLTRQFRLMLTLQNSSLQDSIDEIKRLAPWQKGKLEKQAKLFDTDLLKQIYSKIFKIDLGQKTGTLSVSLVQAIDFLLLDI